MMVAKDENAAAYTPIDMEMVRRVISNREALRDVLPVDWSDDVLSGKTKAVLNTRSILKEGKK